MIRNKVLMIYSEFSPTINTLLLTDTQVKNKNIKHTMRYLFLVLIIFSISSNGFTQSAWTQPKGDTYLQLSFSMIANYNVLFRDSENSGINLPRSVTDNTLQAYSEYGLSDRLTLVAVLPLKLLSTGEASVATPANASGNLTALGNSTIGARYLLYNKALNISTQLNIDLRTSSANAATGLVSGFQAWSVSPSLNIGKGWKNYFVQTSASLMLQSHQHSHYYRVYAETGYKFFDRIWLMAFIDLFQSFENGNVSPQNNQILTGLYLNNQQFFANGVKIVGEITSQFGLNLTSAGAFSGDFVAKKRAISIGAYYKFKK